MSKGYTYILECADGSYNTGSTIDLDLRLTQHQNGEGVNHTRKRLPVKLVYFEEYQRIDDAFYREKQIQGWGHRKKQALVEGRFGKLPGLSSNSAAIRELTALTEIPVTQTPQATNLALRKTKLYKQSRRRYTKPSYIKARR